MIDFGLHMLMATKVVEKWGIRDGTATSADDCDRASRRDPS